MTKKTVTKAKPPKKSVTEKFKICSFTEMAAKRLRRSYDRAGYKFVSMRYDEKKNMFEQTFLDKDQ